MATYLELYNVKTDPGYPDWAKRVEFSISVAAQTIAEDPASTAGKDEWARNALANPAAQRPAMEQFVLADNRGEAVSAILSATDSQIQAAVDKAVNALIPDTL